MEQRNKIKITVEPAGPEVPGPIMQFQLVRTTELQQRRSERERWLYVSAEREVIADGMTRDHVAALISDAADVLSYIEGAPTF